MIHHFYSHVRLGQKIKHGLRTGLVIEFIKSNVQCNITRQRANRIERSMAYIVILIGVNSQHELYSIKCLYFGIV